MTSSRMKITLNYRVFIFLLIVFCLLFILSKYFLHSSVHNSNVSSQSAPIYHSSNNKKFINTNQRKLKSDSTGSSFEGNVIRRFNLSLEAFEMEISSTPQPHPRLAHCKKWAVLTTINEPTEPVRRFGYDPSWCLVIFGDTGSSEKVYRLKSSLGSNIIYLSDKDQRAMGSNFVDELPWKSFGRKNAGYLFAIAHNAEVIYDFDDDNMHKFWIPDSLPPSEFKTINDFKTNEGIYKTFEPIKKKGCQVFNPYPYLGGPIGSWPRGFPLDCLSGSNRLYKNLINETVQINSRSPIGVLQSLADNEPDVDAIYRLTQSTPFNFGPHSIAPPGVILPKGIYSPYNAQATLHFPPGFWALYLPTTVSGRVSDILRSYVAKRLFDIFETRVGFLSVPLVVQIRNVHSYLADFNAETPLYTQISVLLKYLDSYKPSLSKVSPPDVILNLWIGLYERGYVEESDVLRVHKWLQTLLHLGYSKFTYRHPVQKSKDQQSDVPFLHLNVGSMVHSTGEEELTTCKKKGTKLWSPDFDMKNQNMMPTLDTYFILSSLQQKAYVGSSESPSNVSFKYDVEFSSIIGKREPKGIVPMLKDLKVTSKLISGTDILFCHINYAACLNHEKKGSKSEVGLILATRFNENQCSEKKWKERIQDINQFSKNGFICSQNRFDKEYLRHFTNIDALLIPPISSLKESSEYMKKDRGSIFYLGKELAEISQEIRASGHRLKKGKFSSSRDFNDVLAVVYLPEDVISYELNQIYSWNIPILTPTIRFLREQKALSRPNLCQSTESIPSYSQSWHPIHPGDSRNNTESLVYWWQLSDAFDLPHIFHFKNGTHLRHMLKTLNFEEIGLKMRKENEIQRALATKSWCFLISKTK